LKNVNDLSDESFDWTEIGPKFIFPKEGDVGAVKALQWMSERAPTSNPNDFFDMTAGCIASIRYLEIGNKIVSRFAQK